MAAPGWASRLLAAGDRRGTFDLSSLDLAAGLRPRHAGAHHADVVE